MCIWNRFTVQSEFWQVPGQTFRQIHLLSLLFNILLHNEASRWKSVFLHFSNPEALTLIACFVVNTKPKAEYVTIETRHEPGVNYLPITPHAQGFYTSYTVYATAKRFIHGLINKWHFYNYSYCLEIYINLINHVYLRQTITVCVAFLYLHESLYHGHGNAKDECFWLWRIPDRMVSQGKVSTVKHGGGIVLVWCRIP